MPEIQRFYVATRHGRIHVASCGDGRPILLLHQTPRSWDEYRDVLPLLGSEFRAIAMDTPGFGDSDPAPSGSATIEVWAATALAVLTELGVERAAVAGHHTGAAIALEAAAQSPGRVSRLILSACPFVDAPRRARHAARPVIDEVDESPNGEHLIRLWRQRRPYYPANNIDLLNRLVRDALRAGPLAAEGHRIVNRYRMEDRIGLVRSPTLVIAPAEDPNCDPACRLVAQSIPGSILHVVPGGQVPFPDGMPKVFADLVRGFVPR